MGICGLTLTFKTQHNGAYYQVLNDQGGRLQFDIDFLDATRTWLYTSTYASNYRVLCTLVVNTLFGQWTV